MENVLQTLDPKLCIICGKHFEKGKKKDPYVQNPTVEGLQRILTLAQQRDDDVRKTLAPYTDDILSSKIKVSYHVSCRANYCSNTKISEQQQVSNVESESTSAPRRLSRADTTSFKIRRDCFICGKASSRPEPLTAISTGTGASTRDKVLRAASERLDEEVHLLILSCPDLFAYDAKYHKMCLAHYISERNIAFTSDTACSVASVLYLPFIRESPSELSTIYTSMIRLVQLAAELGQHHILVTADLAIYSKAQQILWSKPLPLQGKITMRLGGMHITMAYLASIGKLYGDGGLFDILTESDVYAEGTARQLLQGKQLARGVRSIKLASEALFRLFWQSMQSWLEKQGLCAMTESHEQILRDVQHAFHGNDKATAQQLISEVETELPEIQKIIQMFINEGVKQSATFGYWLMFLNGADLLLRILRLEREADFQLHLNCMCEVMPWLRAAGRTNYGKYMPVYVAEMKALEHEQPEAYTFMQQGGFVVRRSEHRSFNCVATDQALEQTINQEGKSQGGVVGFTLRKGALTRWLMTRHVTTVYVDAMKELCDTDDQSPKAHKEHGASRMDRDERHIQKIMEAVEQRQNPFDLDSIPEELINIASGQVSSEKVAKDLSSFLQEGAKQNAIFIEQRLAKSKRTKSFWEPEKRNQCATFKDMKTSVGVSKSREVHMDSDVLFRRLLAVSKQREVSMETVMSHELAAVPPSLFYDDGSMRKTTKADLAKKLEAVVEETQQLPNVKEPSAYIIDGMALLQSLNDLAFQTFNDLGECVWKKITTLMGKEVNSCVVIVFDRYDHQHSVKDLERQRSGTIHTSRRTHIITGQTSVPNYRKFLRISGNKAALCSFVSTYIASTGPTRISSGNTVILAGGFENGQEVKRVSKSGIGCLEDLYSDQEEADTRLVLHAIHLAQSHSRLIVKCDDTDVL